MDKFMDYALENPPVYIALILVCLAVIIVPLIISSRAQRFGARDPKGNLTKKQQQAINVGAIIGAVFGDYHNNLQTKKFRSMTVIEGWDIHSPPSAKETISWLIHQGHRAEFDQIKSRIDHENDPIFASKRNREFAKNLRKSIPLLLKQQVIRSPEEISEISTLAWDMGRLVNITRWSYDLKYVTEEEAWEVIGIAYEEVLKTYDSWDDFAKGYLVGRALWGGTSGGIGIPFFNRVKIKKLQSIIRKTKSLLEHQASPWNQTPFK